MRTDEAILEELQKARADYHEAAEVEKPEQLSKRSKAIKGLMQELSDYYTEGADPCPDCDNIPHGMQKNPQEVEIGCLHCQPQSKRVEHGRVTRIEPRVRANSRERAVLLWNEGVRMERQVEG